MTGRFARAHDSRPFAGLDSDYDKDTLARLLRRLDLVRDQRSHTPYWSSLHFPSVLQRVLAAQSASDFGKQ